MGLEPYPLRAAAILEDAYQFLAWHLGAGQGGDGNDRSSSSPTVLLTVQVCVEHIFGLVVLYLPPFPSDPRSLLR